ncbi:DUF982 domain-containing protein [Pseudochrobactrum sp. Wa41.01b-1]|uniref:DUF982 domain-containing protein n=1 Tax=Pseudochrobactrum sp. Wa41.01b-1 TaxID=2864102 RepID=UPI001C689E7F|nr:DUF982 domain-containing protein [Pseudochrobactrum sp. Wa41.01b-1]QYM72917.1 DUF982 domain-containing protein [Pseudochrobactrum sp. Wa41.01b-1]
MSERLFDKPVFVKNGRYLTLEIASVRDALMFLHEWPEDDRDLIYDTAWKACCDVHDEIKPVIVAQNAIKGFARKRGILDDPKGSIPWMRQSPINDGQLSA